MLTLSLLTAIVSLASVQAQDTNADCLVLHNGFPQIPATGCCIWDENDPENNWTNKTNLGVYCDVQDQESSTVPLGRVKWVEIIGKSLEGSIPEDIDSLAYLDWFNVNKNNVVGSIPTAVCNLQALRRFWVGLNPGMSGTIPECFGDLVNMLSIDFGDTPFTGALPQDLTKMTLLKELWLSYNVNHVFEGLLPDMDSFTSLEWLFAKSVAYPVATSAAFIGVFPDITQMTNFTGCHVIPSDLCRYAHIDASVYEYAPEGCDAGKLPVCSEDFLAALATARAADQYGAPLDYQTEVDYLVAQVENDYDAEAARIIDESIAQCDGDDICLAILDCGVDAQGTKDPLCVAIAECGGNGAEGANAEQAECKRRAALTPVQRDAEDAAIAEAIRRAALTQAQRDAEDEEIRRAALTQAQRDTEDCDGAQYCLAALSCAGEDACIAALAALAVEECGGNQACLDDLAVACDGDETCAAALEIKLDTVESSARSSFAAPGLLTVALLALAVL